MIASLTELTGAYPGPMLGVVAGLVALYPLAWISDKVFGQPRDGGEWRENRTTKVTRLYKIVGASFLLLMCAFVASKAGLM